MKKQIKIHGFIVILFILSVFLISSCELFSDDDFVSWTHVVSADNYTDYGTYAVYKIADGRFNTKDWYDVWIDDSIWDPDLGWSSFESTYDSGTGRFYFEPEYYEGYMEWNAFSDTDIIGATLRFYRRTYPEGQDGLTE